MSEAPQASRCGRRAWVAGAGVGLGALLIWPRQVGATLAPADPKIEVELHLEPSEVAVGRAAALEVQVKAGQLDGAEPEFQGLEGVDIIPRGSSVSMSSSFVNGRSQTEAIYAHRFLLVPQREGAWPVKVFVRGTPALNQPTLRTTGSGDSPRGESGAPKPAEASEEAQELAQLARSKKSFALSKVSADEVYVGEQLVYEFELWDRSGGSMSLLEMPTFRDFWSLELAAQRRPRRERAGGRVFQVHVPLRRALFPQRAGELELGGGVFESTGLGFGLFRSPRAAERVEGQRALVRVKPLPAKGQPANFPTNNVGSFEIQVRRSKKKIRVGGAVELTVTVRGEGHLGMVKLRPWTPPEELRAYDPQIEPAQHKLEEGRVRGSRVWKQLLVAEAVGKLELPPFELDYFDPSTGRYEVARTKALKLRVRPAKDGTTSLESEEPPEDESTESGGDPDGLWRPIRGGQEISDRYERGESVLGPNAHALTLLAAPAALGAASLFSTLRERLAPSELARRRATERERRSALLARATSGESESSKWSALAELLQGMAMYRLGDKAQGLTRARLEAELAREVGTSEARTWAEIMELSDAARFGAPTDAQVLGDAIVKARSLSEAASWQ